MFQRLDGQYLGETLNQPFFGRPNRFSELFQITIRRPCFKKSFCATYKFLKKPGQKGVLRFFENYDQQLAFFGAFRFFLKTPCLRRERPPKKTRQKHVKSFQKLPKNAFFGLFFFKKLLVAPEIRS